MTLRLPLVSVNGKPRQLPPGDTLNAPAPAGSFYLGSNQTIPNTVFTKVLLDSTLFSAGISLDAANNRVFPGVGRFLVVMRSDVGSAVDRDYAICAVYKNGSLYVNGTAGYVSYPGVADLNTIACCIVDVQSASDYLEFYLYINTGVSGGSRPLTGGSRYTYMQLLKV
ncbi:hypothetical protein [Pseudomonas sp. TUM22785]|uniref:hypothetical protein n=1 Tax=Pseudomonas sp. TUM22785 TaxID=3019098 RepID=UPI0023056CFF|nr:hypothetical protein [Pseudomonas sp. TUM22785]WCD79133.1 hypothetical protein PI990_24530 [Pseudomonas sp. TUM22785]